VRSGPTPTQRTLARGAVDLVPLLRRIGSGMHAVKRDGEHRWFAWYPPPLTYLEIGFVHRSPRPWIVSSVGAPAWL